MLLTKFVWNVPLLPTAIVPVPPTTAPVFVCQGGSGSLTASSICVDNFAIPALPGPNQIYGGWLPA
ncbi:MAG TPA: hypothetical protein PLM03_10760, partial [Bacteroidia bacterium]|nr:hypothetical protein [Bacteroidia bacterium]